MRGFFRFLLFFLLVPVAVARADLSALASGPWAEVATVVDGDTVTLTRSVDGSDTVRLVGLQAPKIALGRAGFVDWPFGTEAKAALGRLVAGKRVQLKFGGRRMDRHGRHLAHLFLEDGTWVQGAMLAQGFARVYTFADNRAVVTDMLMTERDARAGQRGMWAHPFYAVRDATDLTGLARDVGTFQVVEGRVLDAARVKGRVYLNFGADWRHDFTVRLPREADRLFKDAALDPVELKGHAVRVRGWLDKRNGPEIKATHPEQIEIVQ